MRINCNTLTSGCRYDTPADRVHNSTVALDCSTADSFTLLPTDFLYLGARLSLRSFHTLLSVKTVHDLFIFLSYVTLLSQLQCDRESGVAGI